MDRTICEGWGEAGSKAWVRVELLWAMGGVGRAGGWVNACLQLPIYTTVPPSRPQPDCSVEGCCATERLVSLALRETGGVVRAHPS